MCEVINKLELPLELIDIISSYIIYPVHPCIKEIHDNGYFLGNYSSPAGVSDSINYEFYMMMRLENRGGGDWTDDDDSLILNSEDWSDGSDDSDDSKN
jgi:hypothetical protein